MNHGMGRPGRELTALISAPCTTSGQVEDQAPLSYFRSLMDIFAPVVPESELHRNFRSLQGELAEADREVLADWASGFEDRDGKFVREFQTTFNSSFWELYLFACLKHLDYRVDFGHAAPDFVIRNFHNEFCVEAAIASNAIGEEAEWERDIKKEPPNVTSVLDTAVIRLSNAIDSKHKKFLSSYSSLPHVRNRPFLLAIGPFEQPYFWAQNDHGIRQVLYGYDRVGPHGEHLYRTSIKKRSGATIELGLFSSDRLKEISAVIFSNTATMSKVHALNSDRDAFIWFTTLRFNAFGSQPILQAVEKKDYHEGLLEGLYVFHNPFALHPVPTNWFQHEDITQAIRLPDEPVPRYYARHGNLIQRGSFSARAVDDNGKFVPNSLVRKELARQGGQ